MNQYLKMIFTQTVQFFMVMIIFSSAKGEPWFQNKMRDTIVLISSYLAFMIFPLIGRIVSKPVLIKITQTNKLGSGIDLTALLVESNELKTHQEQRTIKLNIEITRRHSWWWWWFRRLIKDHLLLIEVNTMPAYLHLQPKDHLMIKGVVLTHTGFTVSISDIIKDLEGGYGKLTVSKSFPFFVANHSDFHIPDNISAVIQPRIYYNNKALRFLRLFISYETNIHKIGLYKK